MSLKTALLCSFLLGLLLVGCANQPAGTPEPARTLEPRYAGVLPRAVGNPQAPPGAACIALFDHGLTCLDESGWHTFTADNSPLRGNLHQVLTCPAGYFLIVHTFGLTMFDGVDRWRDVPVVNLPGFVDRAGCDGQNNLWLAHWNGVSYHDGSSWQTLSREQITGGVEMGYVNDIAVAPEGDVWVLFDHGIGHREGERWVVYAEGQGLAEEYYLERIVLDAHGQPWVLHYGGLLHYAADNDGWRDYPLVAGLSPAALALDPEQQIWVAGFSDLLHFDPQGMITDYSATLERRSIGKFLRDLAVDARGRMWLGTIWGLQVSGEEQGEVIYHMHNSGLASNDIFSVAVLAGGPDLPAAQVLPTGSLAGRLVLGDQPLVDSEVELCAAWMASLDVNAPHPCQDYPEYQQVQTLADGSFQLDGILPGYYWLTARTAGQTESGDLWSEPLEIQVQPAQALDLGEVSLK